MNLDMNLPELRRWTVSAAYCYKRGCICRGCLYKEALETKCYMKETVLALYRKFGKPTKAKLKLASVCDEEKQKDAYRKEKKMEKMNDRLKFKVWDKKNKKFDSVQFFIDCDGDLFFDSWDDGLVEAGPSYKVVQCTGLKDKNDKLIFEGDIFVKKYFYPYYNYKNEEEKAQSLDDTNGEIKGEPELCCAGVVEQDEDGFCFKLHRINERYNNRLSQLYIELDSDTASECEVIGNIFENSELLRGEK